MPLFADPLAPSLRCIARPSRGLACLVFWSASAALLSACGGGSSTDTSTAQAAAGTASAADTAAHALAVTPAATTAGWTTIATEGQHYSVSGTRTVRYGDGNGNGTNWISMSVTDGGDCSNAAFGIDPAVGIVKTCQIAVDGAGAWTEIAAEYQTYDVAGTQTICYGDGTAWVSQPVSGTGTCSNAAFGSDPAVGIVKQCQVATNAVTWTRIATEGGGFTTSGTRTVRFGVGTGWVTAVVSGAGTCSNGYFGSDPAFGVVKACEVASAGTSAAPAPTAGGCTPPVAAVDTSATPASVGDGTPASCTEAALRVAVTARSVIRFNCGPSPATIAIAAPIVVPAGRDTVIDGENRITLDGGGRTRLLSLTQPNYRTNRSGLTLQHIALVNAKAPGGGYVAPDPAHPACAYGYATGGGAAVLVQDARLYAIDVDFRNNAAATPGPDIGGGAIYAIGSLDVLVSGSRFSGNSGSNAGAVGLLNSNLRIVNSSFQGNTANGATTPSGSTASCPGVAYAGQGGAGGAGGAVYVDGQDDTDVTVCGSTFTANRANGLAGALFRTPDGAPRRTTIDRSAFVGNTAAQAGALYVMNAAPLDILASTFNANQAPAFGAAQFERVQLNIVNSTFSGNEATHGVGGALALNGSSAASLILNSSFVDNKASGGVGYFSAAIFGDNNFPVRNTVFANNLSTDPYNPMQCTFGPASGSADLQWPLARAVGGATDTACVAGITFADPQLGALVDNGGPTPTRLPAAGSPLRNAGRDCPATDQRGMPRNAAKCTIGAVE